MDKKTRSTKRVKATTNNYLICLTKIVLILEVDGGVRGAVFVKLWEVGNVSEVTLSTVFLPFQNEKPSKKFLKNL